MKKFIQYIVSRMQGVVKQYVVEQYVVYSMQQFIKQQLFTANCQLPTANRLLKNCLLLTAYCFLFIQLTYAQRYPVQVTQTIIPPYSTKLSDYATASDVKLRLNVLLTDVVASNKQVRLKLRIQGNGFDIRSIDFVNGASPIYLNGGVLQQFTNIELASYFQPNNLTGITPQQYNKPLPEGLYTFCWEVYDAFTNQQLNHPTASCSNIYLLLNDPPFLNLPYRGDQIVAQDPMNIIFQWTPGHTNATNVSYEFELRELWDNQINPQAAFLASPNYYSETTYTTTLLYNIGKPTLLPNRRYGWRVKAKSTTGVSENAIFKNDGYSEIYYFTYINACYPPTFALSETVAKDRVKITWQGHPDHKKYHVQYKRADIPDAEWFDVYTYNTQVQISNLRAGKTYEFRVGGTCNELTDFDQRFSYSHTNQFTMPAKDEMGSSYNCGIIPEIQIDNNEPLKNIGINETFTAGDFPVTVKQIQGGNGIFTGVGYIVVPYLADTKIAVTFNDISINTDYQLIDGVIKTTYDPSWGDVESVDDVVEDIEDLVDDIFGEDSEENISDTDVTNDTTTGENTDTNTNDTDTSNTDTNNNSSSDSSTTNNTNATNSDNGTNTTTDTNSNTEGSTDTNNTSSNTDEVVIEYNGKSYKEDDVIEVPYSREETNFAFLLKNYPKNAKINWQVLKLGTDNTSDFANNETTYDNLGIDMKDIHILDVVANYNDEKIKVTIKRIPKTYDLITLAAREVNNHKRATIAGKILYFVNKNPTSEKKDVEFKIKISPNLPDKDIAYGSISWFENEELLNEFGNRKIVRKFNDNTDNIITTSKAGEPNKTEKSIEIKWIKRNFDKNTNKFNYGFDLMPHLKDLARKLGVPVYEEEGKYATDNRFSILADTQFLTTIQNIEDEDSRLVYNEKKQTVKTKLGVKGKFEKPLPGLAIPTVDEEFWGYRVVVQAGIYFFIEANAYGEIGHTKYTEDWIEEKSSRNKEYTKLGEPSRIVLNAKLGLDPKINLQAGENITATVTGKSFATGNLLVYDLIENDISFPIYENGFQLKCTPSATIKIYSWSYTKQWDEYIYNVSW